jgi:hypothetical protein
MLSQNPDKTIYRPIYYASRLMNNAEKNYTTTEKETLTMNYIVKKFKHFLLGNSFTFFVDHQVLLYLVNKLIVIGQIAKRLLLSQEFDFKVIFKPGQVHFLLNQLSRINHEELAIGVDPLSNAQLFGIKIDWYGQINNYIKKGYFDDDMPKEEQSQWVIKTRPYTLYDGHLHKLGLDGVLR